MFGKIFRPRESIIILIQVLSFAAFVWALLYSRNINLWALSFFGYFLITCLGITVTFHRMLAHRSFTMAKPIEFLFSLFGNLGCTGSSLGWVCIHRKHHRFSDVKGDPHGPEVHGRIGAIMGDYSLGSTDLYTIKDLIENPIHKMLHFNYFLIMIGLCVSLYLISFNILVHAYLIPVFFNVFISRMSNWIDHEKLFGKVVYPVKDSSRNVWWWAWLSFGEGWHNNHHSDSQNFRIGRKITEFDPGRYVIHFLILSRLAFEKKR